MYSAIAPATRAIIHARVGSRASPRTRARVGCRAGLFDAFGRGSGTKKAKDEVLRLAREQRRGVGHSPEDRAEMEAAVDALIASRGNGGRANTRTESGMLTLGSLAAHQSDKISELGTRENAAHRFSEMPPVSTVRRASSETELA